MSSGAATLNAAAVNLNALREHARKELCDRLDLIRGKKAIVLDPALAGPLGLVIEVSMLREHGVEKMYYLERTPPDTDVRFLVYIVRPKLLSMKMVANHIHALEKAQQKKEYNLLFVPRRTMLCERVLEEEGVYGDITIGEFHMDMIPFDDDVLSLQLETAFKECFLDGDRTSLFYVARALMKLQSIFGYIPQIKGKGFCARAITDMLFRMRREISTSEAAVVPEIGQLIIIDRSADLITPMLTQLTYEGLMDETLGLTNSYVEVDSEVVNPPKEDKDGKAPPPKPATPSSGPRKMMKIPLNSNDKLYGEIRDMNFGSLGPMLNARAKSIDSGYKERHSAQTVSEIHDFMKKLGSLQQEHKSLRIHTHLAEKVLEITKANDFHRQLEAEQNIAAGTDAFTEYIEELIYRQQPLNKVLRILSLMSLAQGGIKQKLYDQYRRDILQTYGYPQMFTLQNLEKVGLLRKQLDKNPYPAVRKQMRLQVDDIDEANPTDMSYTYSGYAPLSCRIVQAAFDKQGWRGIGEVLKTLPGPTFEETQNMPPGVDLPPRSLDKTYVTMVMFIGGVTYAEISALRFLARQLEGRHEFLIGTTDITTGERIIRSNVETFEV